jgi:hypothetical protein
MQRPAGRRRTASDLLSCSLLIEDGPDRFPSPSNTSPTANAVAGPGIATDFSKGGPFNVKQGKHRDQYPLPALAVHLAGRTVTYTRGDHDKAADFVFIPPGITPVGFGFGPTTPCGRLGRSTSLKRGLSLNPQKSRLSWMAAMPAFAHFSSSVPLGAPETPMPATISPAAWTIMPPPTITTRGR